MRLTLRAMAGGVAPVRAALNLSITLMSNLAVDPTPYCRCSPVSSCWRGSCT